MKMNIVSYTDKISREEKKTVMAMIKNGYTVSIANDRSYQIERKALMYQVHIQLLAKASGFDGLINAGPAKKITFDIK